MSGADVVERGRDEFREYVKTLDNPYRQIYDYHVRTGRFDYDPALDGPYEYDTKSDTVWYNSKDPKFSKIDFKQAALHELAHRHGVLVSKPHKDKDFVAAIKAIQGIVMSSLGKWRDVLRKNRGIPDEIIDIFSALSGGELNAGGGHDAEYWTSDLIVIHEIHADLMSLGAQRKTHYFQKLLGPLWLSFERMIGGM
jgi:hypothetical protein